jgi:hypothetical protein
VSETAFTIGVWEFQLTPEEYILKIDAGNLAAERVTAKIGCRPVSVASACLCL